MYYKKLEGKKCYLSPINIEDYELCTRWLNDMEISIGMMSAQSLITATKEREILEKLQNEPYNFSIVDRKNHTLLGIGGIINIDHINKKAELGIFIGKKDMQGKGYGQESISLILDFAFNILNMNSMHLKVYSYNKIAISCYKKVGFKEAGRLREAKVIGSSKYDEVYMDILAREFESPYINRIIEMKNAEI